jgi:hypothetical protein
MTKLFISLCVLLAAHGGEVPTFRASLTPRAFFTLFGLPIPPGEGDKLEVTITSAEADVYRVSVTTASGRIIRQIVDRPTARPAACEHPVNGVCPAYLPMASFMVAGPVAWVIVEPLIPGPAATQQLSN